MKLNRKLYNEVIRYLTNNERIMLDLTKKESLNKLQNVFIIIKNYDMIEQDVQTIQKAYDKWRRFYIGKDKPIKPMTETMSFRCTPEEKEEIKILLDGRNAKNILLEVLRNE